MDSEQVGLTPHSVVNEPEVMCYTSRIIVLVMTKLVKYYTAE